MWMCLIVSGGVHPDAYKQNDVLCEELLAQIAGGEINALEKLYNLTSTSVYGFALSILRRPQDAEDVMQDAYIKIYSAAKSYSALGKPLAWILKIVRNQALMKIRQNQKVAAEFDENADEFSEDFSTQSLNKVLLNAAMTTLSDEERQIIVLHSVSGLKHGEIADLIGIPLSTALSKYHRALKKLRKIVEGEALS